MQRRAWRWQLRVGPRQGWAAQRSGPGAWRGSALCPRQVESEKQQEHEAQRLREHLALLLGVLLEAGRPPGDGRPLLGQGEGAWEAGTPSRAAELLQRCEALERKTATFENIVCVLNREVERVAVTAEACGRQHRLDQDRIEALSNKVRAGGGARVPIAQAASDGPGAAACPSQGWVVPGCPAGSLLCLCLSRGPRSPFSDGAEVAAGMCLLCVWTHRHASSWGGGLGGTEPTRDS